MLASQWSGLRTLTGHWSGLNKWRELLRARRPRRSARDALLDIGDFTLESPEDHIFLRILKQGAQPYRDQNIGIVASHVSAAYPDAAIVDIGANIGYTAAIIAAQAPRNHLILVEPSPRYFEYLVRNIRQLPNPKTTRKVFVSDQPTLKGELHHWHGTAMFVEDASKELALTCRTLSELAPADTKLVKIDTDGHDFRIIKASIDWLNASRSAVFFENQILSEHDLNCANKLFHRLREIDYSLYIFWDDPGFHMVSTTDLEIAKSLNRYLFKQRQRKHGRPSVYNYDVLCLPAEERNIFDRLTAYYQDY